MANDYFNAPTTPGLRAALSSAVVRTNFANIATGIGDKLPPLTGNGNKYVVVNAAGTALAVTGTALAPNVAFATTTAAPNATVPVVSATATDATTNVDLALIPKGTGALLAAIPDSAATGGNKRGTYALDLQMFRTNANEVASGSGSVALGMNCRASDTGTVAIGDGARATAPSAVAVGGGLASGSGSFCTGTSTSSGSSAVAGGSGCTASGTGSVAMGSSSTASATAAVALGSSCAASGIGSFAAGNRADTRTVTAKVAFGATKTFGGPGDTQIGSLPLAARTTDATPTVLTSDTTAAGTINQVVLQNAQAMAFTGTVVARQKQGDGTASAAWKVEGLIRRESNAASTTLVASTVTAISNVPGWTLALSADTTNGALAVTFTGAAATNIQTVARIDTSECLYA